MAGEARSSVSSTGDPPAESTPAAEGSLIAYYSTPKLSAKNFIKQLSATSRHSFDVEDRRAAAGLIRLGDPEFRRTLDLAVQALTARTRMTRDLVMTWVAEVVRAEWAVRAPSVDMVDAPPLEALRQVAQIVRRPPPVLPAHRPVSPPDGTKAEENRKRKLARQQREALIQLLKLAFLWMSITRRVSIVDARDIISGALGRGRRQAVDDEGFVPRLIAPAKSDRLATLLEFAGLWEGAVESARESERTARRSEAEARERIRSLESLLEEAGNETTALTIRIEGLQQELDDLRIALLGQKQSAATSSKELSGRILRLLNESIAAHLEIVTEALEVDPPVIEVALKNLGTALRNIGEASQWLKPSG
jgi:hypothetical protein